MVPYVEIFSGNVWEKEVFRDLRLVLWTGKWPHTGWWAPSWAPATTLLASGIPLTSVRSSSVNTMPTFLWIWGSFFSGVGLFSRCPQMALSIMVFLSISTTVLPPQGHEDLLHLFGTHIVCSHSEALWEIIQKLDALKEAFGLPVCPVFSGHHGSVSGFATQGLKMTSL